MNATIARLALKALVGQRRGLVLLALPVLLVVLAGATPVFADIREDYNIDPKEPDAREKARRYMCERYFDVRAFGAVMDTGDYKCGQVRGPVQLCFGRSVDPILQQEITITRVAITTEQDAEKKKTEMGRKHIVPYALYRAEGYVSANLARRVTGGRRPSRRVRSTRPAPHRKLRAQRGIRSATTISIRATSVRHRARAGWAGTG